MQVKTSRFGTIEFEESDIVRFDGGLPGFLEEREFVLLPYEEDSPFVLMQSATEDYLAFLLTDPFLFFKDYEFEIDETNMQEMEIVGENDIAVYSMVTVPQGEVKNMTTNLLAPVVINVNNRSAKQIVLEKSNYTTKHRLFPDETPAAGGI